MDTKKLRQKILDLAIRGKLVPQDPNDEPASVLLERIRAEKERLIAEGKIKRPKKSKASSSKSHYQNFTPPFDIPASWEWVRLGDVIEEPKYGTSAKSLSKGKIPVLRMGNINKDGTVSYSNLVYSDNDSDIIDYQLKKGDILFNRTNSSDWVGKSALYNGEQKAIYAGYLVRVRPILILSEYLILVMTSDYYRNWCYLVKTDAVNQSNINAQKLVAFMLPLPPLKEQKRIIDSFFKLSKLVCNISDSCNMLSNMISLTKSKILDLAMQGKLVPQDPTDEPAAEMLQRINPKAKIITDNPHYPQLPENWVLTNIETINEYQSITVNPAYNPTQAFELYSVPVFNTGCPEFLLGNEIGSTKQVVKKDDVLLCKINPHLNRVWEIEKDSEFSQIASSEWIVVRSSILNPSFMKYYFESRIFRKLLCSQVSGVGGSLTRAQPTIVKKYSIPIPPYAEQLRIVKAILSWNMVLDEISNLLN